MKTAPSTALDLLLGHIIKTIAIIMFCPIRSLLVWIWHTVSTEPWESASSIPSSVGRYTGIIR